MTRSLAVLMMLAGVPVLAQTPPQPSEVAAPAGAQSPGAPAPAAPAPEEQPTPDPTIVLPTTGIVTTTELTLGGQGVSNNSDSSKLTEYRDLRDGFVLPAFRLSARDRRTQRFVSVSGSNVHRSDRSIFVDAGELGAWHVRADWLGVPHNFSNKALTPYGSTVPGLLQAPATVPITFKKLATASADASGVLASDALIAGYQAAFLVPTSLGTQTDVGRFGATWSRWEALTVEAGYALVFKDGSKSSFGPIGDRPPRTLNIQLAEPVDYRTNELTLALEHQGDRYQVRGEYEFSDFANGIDTMQWQNVYTSAAPGADFDVWDRLVATAGARPLPPDNRYQSVSASGGIDLPLDSRLNVVAGIGRLEQNEPLLPYATFQSGALASLTLPRATAEALIKTTNVALEYAIAPVARTHVRAFFRRYGLDNDTPSDRWQYVTSDTTGLSGTVSYLNKRVSLPFAWDRRNAGVEASRQLPARSSVALAYELESIGREFREADTTEHIFRATWRTRAARWVSMKARFLSGSRDGGVYDGHVTREGYWYAPSEATDANNPQFTFDNHPDMRRFDVSDRARRQADFTVNLTPSEYLALSGFVRYRRDDFDSGVTSSEPLLGLAVPDQLASTPGDQLGRLKDSRLRYGFDIFAEPRVGLTLNAFINYDRGSSLDRSLEFNENNKQNPSTIATAELGPWTRRSSQWTADTRDRAWSGGGGARVQLVEEGAALFVDYTLSIARMDLEYAGFGVRNFDGTPFPPNHQFAFSTPSTVVEDLHVANIRLEIPIRTVILIAGYSFEWYDLKDWQQGAEGPWVEPVGAPTLLRDTSRSHQWGNRLFALGTYLAPGYRSHTGMLSLRYRF